MTFAQRTQTRRGAASVLMCVLMAPLLFLLAFSIDYGFLLFVETSLQKAADQAALAGARDLVPSADGSQDLPKVRETVREYIRLNVGSDFVVLDSDIEIGRYEPNTVYSGLELKSDGILDTVRVTVRRNDLENKSVSLYFARLFGTNEAGVTVYSTAALQKAKYLGPGSDVFPFTIQNNAWNRVSFGNTISIYGDGRIESESGTSIPGNWGTVDIGYNANSTASLSNQIRTGLTQQDLNALYDQGSISTNTYIDATADIWLNGDTGLSSGLRHALADVEGQTRIAPIYRRVTGQGGGLEFLVIGWTSVKVIDSGFRGSQNSYVNVQKSYLYDEHLRPSSDLSDTSDLIEGAYTSPTLLQ